jgi:sulfur carrier protein ThiS
MSNASSAPPLTPIAQSAAVIIGDVLRFAAGQAHSVAELRQIGDRIAQLQAAISDAEQAVAVDEESLKLSGYPTTAVESFDVVHIEMDRWKAGSISKLGLGRLQQHCRVLAQLAYEAQQHRPEMAA